MRVIDLFAGCGGLSLGFIQAGYNIVAAFENWLPAIEVYRRNFSHPLVKLDLSTFSGNTAVFEQFAPDIIIGGPPCQDFSSAGKRDEGLGRSDLTVVFAQITASVTPKLFVMENVERAANSQAWKNASQLLHSAGYGITQITLDASLCGVPQYRKRFFAIGERWGTDNAFHYVLTQQLARKPMTLRDYFGERLGIEHYYRHPRSYQRRGVFSVDEPSPTIRGVNRPIPSTYRGHIGDTAPVSKDLRPLTTHERALIQTFPEDFQFFGTKSDVEQMIGNAVPVNLAYYVAEAINRYLNRSEQDLSHLSIPKQLALF